ncbi:aquaporin, partial [Paenibacillus sp. TAF58]
MTQDLTFEATAHPVETVPSTGARIGAEIAGTFLLVFGVIGTAIFAAGFGGGEGGLNVGFLGVALALGLSVLAGAYAFGPISGGHFNPAVTLGLAVAGRIAWRE